MKQYFFIDELKKQSIFSEFNEICKDVNLLEIDENDAIECTEKKRKVIKVTIL